MKIVFDIGDRKRGDLWEGLYSYPFIIIEDVVSITADYPEQEKFYEKLRQLGWDKVDKGVGYIPPTEYQIRLYCGD